MLPLFLNRFFTKAVLCYALLFFGNYLSCSAQSTSTADLHAMAIAVSKAPLTSSQKLSRLYAIKIDIEKNKEPHNSDYAFLLYQLGVYELDANHNYNKAIDLTLDAFKISRLNKADLANGTAFSYACNLVYDYENINFHFKSLAYCDTIIATAEALKTDNESYVLYAKIQKANIYSNAGDFQKCIEECISGIDYSIQKNDSSYYYQFLLIRAFAYYYESEFANALFDLDKIIIDKNTAKDWAIYTYALEAKALVYEKYKRFSEAISLFKTAIKSSIDHHDYAQASRFYNNFGTFYINSLHQYDAAKKWFINAAYFAKKNSDDNSVSIAYVNLGEASFDLKNYNDALKYYNEALNILNLRVDQNILSLPLSRDLNLIDSKELVIRVMANRTKLLLQLSKENKDKNYLVACLKTALVTDSVITETRHEQIGELSKLFWRDNTREFFQNAIEACYAANDASLAFYFMEKSRAVLLNDKLNELGAAAYLPYEENDKQETLQANVIGQQQALASLNKDSKEYTAQQRKLLDAKEIFEKNISSLEKKYPAYYQYKYADIVFSLSDLQKYLSKQNENFVHYFLNDSIAFALAINKSVAKLIKLDIDHCSTKKLSSFLLICSDKQTLNNHYDSFAKCSYALYKLLFAPLQLSKNRTIICPDNFLIPFEALCDDENGKHFLLNDYAFSYVYSARYLMNNVVEKNKASGNFLGMAPIHFASGLNVPDLLQGDEALQRSASHYNNSVLLTFNDASRKNFLKRVGKYTVVNIFSHAQADSTNEPLLYMCDSVIHLSELQLLDHPCVQLVVLSACQTNVGKNATGEGIYSLARGFAAAGIPSVAATLWKADDQTVYCISEKFHEYLSQGLPKDIAMQKAKIYFIENNSSEKLLPYYWANMVLAGNADPIRLSTNMNEWWWISAACILLALITFLMLRKRKSSIAKYLFKTKS